MSKTLINTLLKICQLPGPAFEYPASAQLKDFCLEYGLGLEKRRFWVFSEAEIGKVKIILLNLYGIDWKTDPSAWEGKTRAEALTLGSDEKLTSKTVRQNRVAVKALDGRPLLLGRHDTTYLPGGANLDIDWQWLAKNSRHREVLVIENWENFENCHLTPLLDETPGNPLVVFRGFPQVYTQDHVVDLLSALACPTLAFVDLDPQGLLIANTLPGFDRMIAPDVMVLEEMLKTSRNHERYRLQVKHAAEALQSLKHEQLRSLFELMERHQAALPQEIFIKA